MARGRRELNEAVCDRVYFLAALELRRAVTGVEVQDARPANVFSVRVDMEAAEERFGTGIQKKVRFYLN